jgi:flagellar protein FliS
MLPPDYIRGPRLTEMASVDRARLLRLVLDGGQAFLLRARHALEGGDVAGFIADLGRTQDALVELTQALDHTRDAAVAAGLDGVYDILVGDLALADAARSLGRIDAAIAAFGPTAEAYRRLLPD